SVSAADGWVVPNRGDGTLGPDHRSDALLNASRLAAGDLNGDGVTDLVVFPSPLPIGAAPHFALLLGHKDALGHGDGTFQPPRDITTTLDAAGPQSAVSFYGVVADFNHDGKPDVAVFATNSLVFQVFLGTGNADQPFAAPVDKDLPESLRAVAAGDLDGDGRADLVIGGTTSGNIHTLIADPAHPGSFTRGPSAFANTD